MLEAMQYKNNAFVTLTYDNAHLVVDDGGANLYPRDLQLFLKKIRHKVPKFRFFAVGEYGDESQRPHYHLGIFNFHNCARGETHKNIRGRCMWSSCCPQCRLVGETWEFGDIEIRDLGASKCEYLARYIVKKMTKKEDARLAGRHPEFSRQSNQGGIGLPAVAAMAKTITAHVRPDQLTDVPQFIKQGPTKKLPLGRYLRNKLRGQLGLPEKAPEHALRQAWTEQVLPVLKMAQEDGTGLQAAFAKINEPLAAAMDAKMEVKKGKGKL